MITAFLALSLSSVLLVGGLEMFLHTRALKRSISGEQQVVAQRAASSVSDFIIGKTSILETVARIEGPIEEAEESWKRVLAMLIGYEPAFRNVVFYDLDGSELSHASRQSEQQYRAFTNRVMLYWPSVIEKGDRYIGPVHIDTVTNEPLVTIAMPVRDVFGDIRGRLVAEVNLKFMWDLVGGLDVGKKGQVYVVDRAGRLLAHRDIARVLRREIIDDVPEVREFITMEGAPDTSDTRRAPGVDGGTVISTYVPLGVPDWAVITEIPFHEAYAEAFRSALYSFLVLAVTAVFAGIAAIAVTKRLTDPITALTNVSAWIAGGDFSRFADEEGPEEIAALAGAFNTMTRRLTEMITVEERRSRELEEEISLRHDTEKALRESEERLELALDAANEGIWDWHMAENYVLFDDRYYTMAGYEPGAYAQSFAEWEKRIHPNDHPEVMKKVHNYTEGLEKSYNTEFRFLRADGTYMWIRASGKIVSRDKNGNPVRFIGTHSDITVRKEAEEELKKAQDLISNIVDSMPSMIVGVDENGSVTLWNTAAEKRTGRNSGDAIGRHIVEALPWIEADYDGIVESIRTGKIRRIPNRKRDAGSDLVYEDYTIFPLMAAELQGAVVRIDDVTEKNRIEEMMLQSEKMLSVGGLAAGMAHEINNPLGGMIQNAGLVMERMTNDEIPANLAAAEEAGTTMDVIRAYMKARRIDRLLENVRKSGSRAAEIVTNMLSFARTSETSHSTHNLAELIDKTVDLAGSDYNLKKKYDFRKIEIVREFEDVPEIPCEAGKIQQVLLNILRNGAEAMHMDESREEAETPRFVLRLSKDGPMARIEVEDNGPGMPDEVRRRVFEPFYTTKPTDEGTGLGLSVSYFIITENHGGEMSVESSPGEGTTFTVKLPVSG